MSKAVVLLSGGLDSATALAVALRDGHEVFPLSVSYGQRHKVEMAAAGRVIQAYQDNGFAVHDGETVTVVFPERIKGSALTDTIEVPVDRPVEEMVKAIPVTYVPARNTFLLGLAASYAEQNGAEFVYVGFNVLDYSGYPDCRPEYVRAYNEVLGIGMKVPATIQAPLVLLSKAEIVKLAMELHVPMEHTWSCYKGGDRPCGHCDSCILRTKAFEQLGVDDPALR